MQEFINVLVQNGLGVASFLALIYFMNTSLKDMSKTMNDMNTTMSVTKDTMEDISTTLNQVQVNLAELNARVNRIEGKEGK